MELKFQRKNNSQYYINDDEIMYAENQIGRKNKFNQIQSNYASRFDTSNRKKSDQISMHSEFLSSNLRRSRISRTKLEKNREEIINSNSNSRIKLTSNPQKQLIQHYKTIQQLLQSQNQNLKAYNKSLLKQLNMIKSQKQRYKQILKQKNKEIELTLLQKQAYKVQIQQLKNMLYTQVCKIQMKYKQEYEFMHNKISLNQEYIDLNNKVDTLNPDNYYGTTKQIKPQFRNNQETNESTFVEIPSKLRNKHTKLHQYDNEYNEQQFIEQYVKKKTKDDDDKYSAGQFDHI